MQKNNEIPWMNPEEIKEVLTYLRQFVAIVEKQQHGSYPNNKNLDTPQNVSFSLIFIDT